MTWRTRENSGILGILLICLISGTVLIQFLVLGRESSPIQILDNTFPSRLPDSDKAQEFSFAFITGRDFAEVDLRFSMLMREPVTGGLNHTLASNISTGELAALIPSVSSFGDFLRAVGKKEHGLIEVVDKQIELPDGTEGRAVLYDFGRISDVLRPKIDSRIPYSYLVVVAENGTVVDYAEGVPDFFFAKWTSIKKLVLSKGEEKAEFFPEYFAGLGVSTISSAPAGRMIYENVLADTKISVYFSILASAVPLHDGMYQVIRVYGDRELCKFVLNKMEPGSIVS